MAQENKDTLGKLGIPPIYFNGVNKLKGVVAGEDYPIIGIDTERDAGRKKLVSKNQ